MNIDRPMNGDIAGLRFLWYEAFGDSDEFLDIFFMTAFSRDRCMRIRIGEEIAAALYWFDCSVDDRKIAYIYAVATLEKYRGKGLCRELMNAAHRCLAAVGFSGAVLVPSEKSLFGFYGKMGYRVCSHIEKFSCEAEDNTVSVSLRRLGGREYAALRSRMLPAGGVIQEGENIEFLLTQTELYCGDGVVFAARREGDRLICPEFLGEKKAASGILRELGCVFGDFRVPSGEDGEEFAMYLPFDGGEAPSYFGLAFD